MVPKFFFMPFSFNIRSLMYNMFNRVYCITFDYQHRSPVPEELELYRTTPWYTRIWKIGKAESTKAKEPFNLPDGNALAAHKSHDIKSLPLGTRYLCDLLCVVGIVTGFNRISQAVPNLMQSSSKFIQFNKEAFARFITPSAIVCAAHASDLFWARSDELFYGIEVYNRDKKSIVDSEGYPITSKAAGKIAVLQTLFQRSFTVVGTLAIASYCRTGLLFAGLLPKKQVSQAMLEVALVALGLAISVPGSMGLVNDYIEFLPTQLEPVFHKCVKYPASKTLFVYRGK